MRESLGGEREREERGRGERGRGREREREGEGKTGLGSGAAFNKTVAFLMTVAGDSLQGGPAGFSNSLGSCLLGTPSTHCPGPAATFHPHPAVPTPDY